MRHRTKHMRRNFPSRIHGSHMHVVVSCRLKKKIIKKSRFPRRRRRRPSMTFRAVAAGCGGEKSADGWRIFMAQISPPTLPCPTRKKKTYTRSRFFFFCFAPREFHMCVIFMTLKFRWHVPVPRPCVSTGGAFFLFPVKIGSAGWHLGIFSAIFPQHRVWHKKVCCGTHMRVWWRCPAGEEMRKLTNYGNWFFGSYSGRSFFVLLEPVIRCDFSAMSLCEIA